MTTDLSEKSFEAIIADSLASDGGWTAGSPATFDRVRALDPTELLAFLMATQSYTATAQGLDQPGKTRRPRSGSTVTTGVTVCASSGAARDRARQSPSTTCGSMTRASRTWWSTSRPAARPDRRTGARSPGTRTRRASPPAVTMRGAPGDGATSDPRRDRGVVLVARVT